MTDTNANTLRSALAAAVKKHVDTAGLSPKDAAEVADVQLSRMYLVLRGDVTSISSDALVNMLGGFGYRLTSIVGSGNGTEIVLSLDKAEIVLPSIDVPAFLDPDFQEAFGISAELVDDPGEPMYTKAAEAVANGE